jgi:hypothetical protein
MYFTHFHQLNCVVSGRLTQRARSGQPLAQQFTVLCWHVEVGKISIDGMTGLEIDGPHQSTDAFSMDVAFCKHTDNCLM